MQMTTAPRALELTWVRCLDGYSIQEPTEDDFREFEERTVSPLPGCLAVKPGVRVVPNSARRQPFFVVDDLTREGTSILDEFLNTSNDPRAILKFYDRFGPLTGPLAFPLGGPVPFGKRTFELWDEDVLWWGGEIIGLWETAHSVVASSLDYVRAGGLEAAFDVFSKNNLGLSYTRIVRAPDNRFHTVVEPANLLALIWIEVAQTITGGAEIRACKACQRPMLIGGYTGAKRTKETCSTRCRFAVYQARKRAKGAGYRPEL